MRVYGRRTTERAKKQPDNRRKKRYNREQLRTTKNYNGLRMHVDKI
jgi:hypothetical protein